MPRLGLRRKFLLAFLVILLPVLALMVYQYLARYEQQTEDILDEQSRATQAIGALVDASLDDALALAWQFSYDSIVRTMDYRQIDSYLEQRAPSLPQYDNVAVLDASGNSAGLMAPRLEPGAPRPNATGRSYFETVKATRKPAVSEVLISRATGNPTVAVVVPMLDESGVLTGMTLVALDLGDLAQRVQAVGLRQKGAVFLTDSAGTVAFHTGLPVADWGQRNLADYDPVRSALQGGTGRFRSSASPLGDERMVAIVRTPKYGWVVGVSIPVAVALRPVFDTLRGLLLGFIAAVILSGGLALLLAELLLRPLGRLTGSVVAFGRGESQAVKIKTGDELELLGDAFSWMAGVVSENQAQMRAHAERLEEEVREREMAQRQLEQVNRELEAFSYSVSHDLRAPLRSIDGFSQALLEDYPDKLDQRGKDYLRRVRAASQRMGQLIDDVLSLSRVTRADLRRETVDLSAMAREIAAELRRAQPGRSVDLVIASGLVAKGDPRLLRVVLDNLIGNAWKFTGKHAHATIEVGVTEQEGKPTYFVRDDGAGFEPEYVDRLFAPFQRLHAMEEFSGTGIGLATVHRIVNRHGGRIWAEGAVEKGATFYFTL